MKLALVRPNLGDYRASDAMPPLALGILAARSQGWDIAFYDEKVEPVPVRIDADLAALSVETFTARRGYALADGYRADGVRVVMGGHHPTFLPEEALEHADAVVLGDAEGVWERLLEDFRKGRLERTYRGQSLPPLDDYRVDRSLFAGKPYAPVELAQFGRGCRYACDFCSVHAFYGTSRRTRPVASLRAELETLPPRRLLFFVDDNLYGDRHQMLALLAMLRPLGRRWACQISIDVAGDDELLDHMAAAGCRYVLIGFESLEAENLRQMRKAWNHAVGPYREVARKLHSRGIGIYGTFVFGYDHDTPETIARSLEFAVEARLDIANFNPLTPTPGTGLYERLRREGRLVSATWWKDPNWRYGDPIFEPRGMSAEELAQRIYEAKRQFYSWRSIALRMLRSDAAFSPFRLYTAAVANWISRREVGKKQHRRLGADVKITFVKPNIGRREHSLYVDEGRMEPLTLGVLAGLTPPDVECALVDDRVESIDFDARSDLAAITVETYTARRAYEIADDFRRRGVAVALGGMHVFLRPEEAAPHADTLVIGDAETVWREVVDDARRGRLKPRYVGQPGVAQPAGVRPRRDLFEGKGYLPIALVQFSRGCTFGCRFCAVSRYFDKRHYLRRIDEVLAEIDGLSGRLLFFVDDNIAANRGALVELCHALIPRKIAWVSQASLDVARDRELLRLLERSGCWGNVMGFESINGESLQEIGKSPNLPGFDGYKEEVAALRNHGLQTWAAFTLGYDHDTVDSIRATVDFALENRFAFAAFNLLMPYPGTPFYDELESQGRLLYDARWWLHPQYRFNKAAYLPARMTAQELTDACQAARTRFNRPWSLVRRFSDLKTSFRSLARALLFWRYTMIFRREVRKKHGMRFGLR